MISLSRSPSVIFMSSLTSACQYFRVYFSWLFIQIRKLTAYSSSYIDENDVVFHSLKSFFWFGGLSILPSESMCLFHAMGCSRGSYLQYTVKTKRKQRNSRSAKNWEQYSENHGMFAEIELLFKAYAVMSFTRKTI